MKILRKALPFLLVILGVAFVVLGIWRGEADTVLAEAITVCLECIGIG